jgi:hypothetical protein
MYFEPTLEVPGHGLDNIEFKKIEEFIIVAGSGWLA